jgi:hypothetical protein
MMLLPKLLQAILSTTLVPKNIHLSFSSMGTLTDASGCALPAFGKAEQDCHSCCHISPTPRV